MQPGQGLHEFQPIYTAGQPLGHAKAALILLHGRGASAHDILLLAEELYHPAYAYVAPQAAGNTWYPYPFLAPMQQNEPWLSSALAKVGEALGRVEAAGIPAERIVLAGFSQGACLASEFVARHARRYGGLLAFSGGLIGPPGTARNHAGRFDGMPVFLGCGDADPHIPAARVEESAAVFERMGAEVTKKLYPNMGHTIVPDELTYARKMVKAVVEQELPE